MTTDERLRGVRRRLLQASTMVRDVAEFGGGLGEETRTALREWSRDLRDDARVLVARVRKQCAEDLEAARRGRAHRKPK